jgi:hypothetical protein
MKTTRDEVYEALNSERAYQAVRWSEATTESGGRHDTVPEWIMYMEDYLAEAKHIMSREGEPECTQKALHIMRKVTALGVACMENLGAPRREGY